MPIKTASASRTTAIIARTILFRCWIVAFMSNHRVLRLKRENDPVGLVHPDRMSLVQELNMRKFRRSLERLQKLQFTVVAHGAGQESQLHGVAHHLGLDTYDPHAFGK